jgi:ferredoxin-NADP reductase/anaerobic selenocysteine-containing dehydrogenase
MTISQLANPLVPVTVPPVSAPPDSGPEPVVPTIEHAGVLEDLHETPRYVMPLHEAGVPQMGRLSCSFCGVGDGGTVERVPETPTVEEPAFAVGSAVQFTTELGSLPKVVAAKTLPAGGLHVTSTVPLVAPGAVVRGEITLGEKKVPFVGREVERVRGPDGLLAGHIFKPFVANLTVFRESLTNLTPTTGCIKLRHSMMRQRVAYPIHLSPSVLDPTTGRRKPISYQEAIQRLADLMLRHRQPAARTLIYASGQVDYFAVFATQEVYRLLGVRNLTGNAEHCLNAGAVHNEMLTGQEGPFLTVDQAINGPNRFFVFNGWNGMIGHPPAFRALLQRQGLDCYLVEVMVTESAKAIAEVLDKDRILLIRPRSDPHLALAIAHEILLRYPEAVSKQFVGRFADEATFASYVKLARSERFAPERVAERIAPEPEYVDRLLRGIRRIALKMSQRGVVPINIPSVGLSQTSGAVAHCLWGSLLGMLGKYGINPDGSVAGGTLRLPGQINAESEVQGMSRKYFMGRIPMSHAADAARRMGLPEDAYDQVVKDPGRAALDYSDPTPGVPELFICMGTQFEANMMGRKRWLDKLTDPNNTLVVIDPIPDSWSEQNAALIIPSPPHPATTKLYQNGEWKFTLSVPQKRAAPETRSDATILYDVMAEITRRVENDPEVSAQNGDLARHARSGYLRSRFCAPEDGGGLTRVDGEVSRAELWQRVLDYMSGGSGSIYCRPEHADGRAIEWTELVERGSIYYGGIGTKRFLLDYDDPECTPFRDVFRRPTRFRFFTPTDVDLEIPTGVLFNSGRSALSDERQRIAFAVATFNSGKATPIVGMPDENPLFISPGLAQKHGIKDGQRVLMKNPDNGQAMEFPAIVSDRVKGDVVYASFHKSKAQMERGAYINDLTSHEGRCAYTSQTNMKATRVTLEQVVTHVAPSVTNGGSVPRAKTRLNTTLIDPKVDLPIWSGRDTPLYVTEIIQDTHNVYTFRLQGDPLCRFVYWPGQFCTLVLPIDGKRVVRSYSISSTPTRPYVLEITIKRVQGGLVSNWMPDNIKVGDRIEISGPKGKFCLVPGKIPEKILFLGAGSGVTPLMSMARWLCDVSADVDMKFFNSIQTPSDIVFHRELEMLAARYRSFDPVLITTSRGTGHGWTGLRGRINRHMLDLVAPDLHERQVYMCGPEGFMTAARVLLTDMAFNLANLHAESFATARSANDEAARAEAPAPGDAVTIEFARTGKRVAASKQLPLLETAEANGVELEYGCRTGNCGECKVRVLSGEFHANVDDGITAEERAAGYVLSCVASPRGDCVVDA